MPNEHNDQDFILGKVPAEKGEAHSEVVDIDSDPESEAGERRRAIRPYRAWTGILAIVATVTVGFFIFSKYDGGQIVPGFTVAIAEPASAVTYEDGTVEISTRTILLKECQSVLGCTPDLVDVEWREDGALIIGVERRVPGAESWPDTQVCPSSQASEQANLGLIVLQNPNGKRPVAVIDRATSKPVIVRESNQVESTQGAGFFSIAEPSTCP